MERDVGRVEGDDPSPKRKVKKNVRERERRERKRRERDRERERRKREERKCEETGDARRANHDGIVATPSMLTMKNMNGRGVASKERERSWRLGSTLELQRPL